MHNKEIIFLTKEHILEIHQEQISSNGGKKGLRDENLLLSAVGEPRQTFDGDYLYKSIYEMAATYLFCFAKNHAFIDGNKRVALKACAIFLNLNRYDLILSNKEFEDLVLECVNDLIDKEKISEILKENSVHW